MKWCIVGNLSVTIETEKPQARMEIRNSTFQTFSIDFSNAAKLHWLVIVHKYMKVCLNSNFEYGRTNAEELRKPSSQSQIEAFKRKLFHHLAAFLL